MGSRSWLSGLCILVLGALATPLTAAAAGGQPIGIRLDASEAEAALAILKAQKAGKTPSDADWKKLFSSEPYIWLKAREASISRPFTDEEFKTYLLSPQAAAREGEWEAALAQVKRSSMPGIAKRVLAWLPAGAKINTRVFPLIKPKPNTFVWRNGQEGPAIFIALDTETQDQFENLIAHESHHIGLSSLKAQQDAVAAGLPERVATAIAWLGAFGEGEAMLAAAGDPMRHPHWPNDALRRARWDADMLHFNEDIPAIEALFNEILDGKIAGDQAIFQRAEPFWGDAQGAWYTVGYEMAVLVELHDGRAALLECMIDPRKLLARYNAIAAKANADGAHLALWSEAFLNRLKG